MRCVVVHHLQETTEEPSSSEDALIVGPQALGKGQVRVGEQDAAMRTLFA